MNVAAKGLFEALQNSLPDYEERLSQLQMADAVFEALNNDKRLLIEAGTGTGKTFAYLIPAITAGRKTVVSTATIALQEQLARKDLLILQKLQSSPFTFAVLKGKNNYLCAKRLADFGILMTGDKDFIQWANDTGTGDKDELPHLPDFWPNVSGDSMDCAGRECPFYEKCFYFRAYKKLYKADIIVVNHYLLMFDLLSGGTLLPSHECLIIDEAHHIEGIISKVAGTTLSHYRIKWLLNRLKGLRFAIDDLFFEIDSCFKLPKRLFEGSTNVISPVPRELIDRLNRLNRALSLKTISEKLSIEKDSADNAELLDKIITTMNICSNLQDDIDTFINQSTPDMVYFIQKDRQGFEFHSRLIETAGAFNAMADQYKSVIMTSATLTTGGSFEFFRQRLGISDTDELIVDSPFDYKRQAALYTTAGISTPNRDEDFLSDSVNIIQGLVNASKGRALALFTSYRHLRYVAERISLPYPFASQGDMPNARLLEWFIETPGSVLLATQSFWQGIDVKGDKLSLLIIAKIPFSPPGDPVYDAQCRRLGDRWFAELALPSAILNIRQGFGRLIRSSSDRGVAAILDSRIHSSSYGEKVIASLPDMRMLRSLEEVESFFDMVEDKYY